MRKDMAQVITECPRIGGRNKYPKGENRKKTWEKNNEVEPKGESIRKKWKVSHEQKKSSEKLGPLYRFLLSKVGCKWDEVYSEICQELNKNSASQGHIRDHVFDFVVVDCYKENGELYDARRPASPIDAYRCYHSLYVLNGILHKLPKEKRKRWHKQPPKFHVGIQALQYRDIWYEVELVAFDANMECVLKDMFLGSMIDRFRLKDFYGSYLRCTRKRQMNSKEIEKLT